MDFFAAEELTEGDVLASGRQVATVELDNEWAGERPIGYADRVVVTFTNAMPDTFFANETVTVIGRR